LQQNALRIQASIGVRSSPSILCGLALHRRRIRVLELEPVAGVAGTIAPAEALGHLDTRPSQPQDAGVTEHDVAGMRDVLIEANSIIALEMDRWVMFRRAAA
jgi:hypothetical protein